MYNESTEIHMFTFIDQRQIKAKVYARREEIANEMVGYTRFDIIRSHNDKNRMQELFKSLSENGAWTEEEQEEIRNLDTTLANLDHEYERLNATLGQDLMEVKTKYVATDVDQLVSPAGFHPSEPVFVQTKVAIHVDDPRDLPKNFKGFIHNIEELRNR
tara:strand:- start:572 stop:1048 length:477 start_codon:yes stop_codon:yes gene_type:complete